MKVSIMQPTYLPWLGYFDLIARSDIFIFLDDVQFSYRSWQQRNRILDSGKERVLTVPVIRKGDGLKIRDTLIDESQNWRQKHINSVRNAYRKTNNFNYYMKFFEGLIHENRDNLNDLNQNLIKSIASHIGLEKIFLSSYDLACDGNKSQKLLNICKEVKATEYLSAAGSRDYIEEEGCFSNSDIKVTYQEYSSRKYNQYGTKVFYPNLSILDLLFNCGLEDINFHFDK